MLSKSDYAKLSAAGKKKLKSSIARAKPSSGRRVVKPKRASTAPRARRANPLAGLAETAGSAIGSYFGPLGSKLGGEAGKLFSKITGFGDYKIDSNSLVLGTTPPVFGSAGRGTLIRHREYLGDVYSAPVAGDFAIEEFPINAGLSSTFNWLSQIANNFEQYAVRGMIFEYKAMSADALNSTNTALGTVIMATQYNSLAPPFTGKAQMEGHEFCTSSRPSSSFMHPIECARGETPVTCLYTRMGSVPSGADQRFYDLGIFTIAVSGMQAANVNLGELWVSYDIELLKPRIHDSLGLDVYEDHYRCSTVSTSAYFGTSRTLQAGSNFGTTFSGNSTLVLPADSVQYSAYIVYAVLGESTSLTNEVAVTLGSNITALAMFTGGSVTYMRQGAAMTSNLQFIIFKVEVGPSTLTTNNTILVSAGTLPAGILGTDLIIIGANPLVVSDHNIMSVVRRSLATKSSGFLELPKKVSSVLREAKEERKIEKSSELDESDEDDYLEYLNYKRSRAVQAEMIKKAIKDAPLEALPLTRSEPVKIPSRK